ncbi:MAG TPA: hypothetical protein VGI39_18760 [Polyangiaceae bacterium]
MDASDHSTLLDDAKRRTTDLFTYLCATSSLGEATRARLLKSGAEIEERLVQRERTILLVGSRASRQALLDRVLGARVFATVQREPETITRLRAGPAIDYEATLRGGAVESFRKSVPEREGTFAKASARAERARAVAADEARTLKAEVEAQQRRATTLVYERDAPPRGLLALWQWILAWLFGPRARPLRPAGPLPPPSNLEAEARDANERASEASQRGATLEADRQKYADERRGSFFTALRGLADALSRGGEVEALTIEVPTTDVPEGLALLSLSEIRSLEGIDGCLILGSVPAGAPSLAGVASRVLGFEAPAEALQGALSELKRVAPFVAAERSMARARAVVHEALEEAGRGEAVCHERIGALERQRLPPPDVFRAETLGRMAPAIDDGARDVLRAALERVPPRIEAIKTEWREALLACEDRGAIEAKVRELQGAASGRIGRLVDDTNEFVVAEMQRASDSMQTWLLEEIHGRYDVARRASVGEGPTPVIADVGSGEFAALDPGPLEDAMLAFEHVRVGYGLGGAAAGAVLGTLVVPVIGTAIGAFLGVFAGLLKGPGTLRQECAARIEACLDESAAQIRAQLEGRRESFAASLRNSLEEALDGAMRRFERSIARLRDLEARTLAAERAKLSAIADLRTALGIHERHLIALADRAQRASAF